MSGPTPGASGRLHRFDAFRLATTRGRLEGRIDPFDLDRVQDRLGDEEGEIPPAEIAYRIAGDVDGSERPVLGVELDGEMPLQCQRCLRVFTWPVHQRTELLLAHDEDELAYLDDNDEREVVLAQAPLDPLQIVEDELLLTMPYVPRCGRPDCLDLAASLGTPEGAAEASAFGALAALKRGGKPSQE